jgi:hypothetical protein
MKVNRMLSGRNVPLEEPIWRCHPVREKVERETGGNSNKKRYLNILCDFTQKEKFYQKLLLK